MNRSFVCNIALNSNCEHVRNLKLCFCRISFIMGMNTRSVQFELNQGDKRLHNRYTFLIPRNTFTWYENSFNQSPYMMSSRIRYPHLKISGKMINNKQGHASKITNVSILEINQLQCTPELYHT